MIDIEKIEALAKNEDRVGPAATTDEVLALIAEVRALREDAERWRKLMSYGEPTGDVLRYERHARRPTTSANAFSLSSTSTVHIVYDEVAMRELKFRWLDDDGRQLTLRDMIDAARAKEKAC